MRTRAFHARNVCDSVLGATGFTVTLPCYGSPKTLDLSCSVGFRAALYGRKPQQVRAGSSVQFSSSAVAKPKRARAANSSAPARPKRD